MTEDARQVAQEIMQRLESAWNSASGKAFGEPFAEDADFVTIRGEYHHSREAIAAGHQGVFDTIYKGSSNHFELIQARKVAETVLLAHVRSTLDAPTGPLAGRHNSVFSLVVVRHAEGWRIASLHNTLVTQ
ncbi:MAG TPA: SgcJ/EcaC family oxidoreductase [Candidatus Acidoferrales bacterium]|nr:SgcJ/EcaC family oxidoreductase [Terriglobia bacterium]